MDKVVLTEKIVLKTETINIARIVNGMGCLMKLRSNERKLKITNPGKSRKKKILKISSGKSKCTLPRLSSILNGIEAIMIMKSNLRLPTSKKNIGKRTGRANKK